VEIDELYQTVILDHSRKPRNFGPITNPTASAKGDNPSCGDEVEVFVKVGPEEKIEEVRFVGQGCAISQASASMMTIKLKGKTKIEAFDMLSEFQQLLISPEPVEAPKILGDLRIFEGVRKFPQRVKCATLAWQALKLALDQAN
jgi:nitrogen fixation NifU-like protein